MDSSSTPSANPPRSSHRLADILGTAIALLTLTMPLWVIGHYSSNNLSSPVTPIAYPLQSPP